MIYDVISWDYRDQPDIDALDRIVKDATGSCGCPQIRILNVDDTGGQDYAVIVTDEELTQEQRTEVYERHERGEL